MAAARFAVVLILLVLAGRAAGADDAEQTFQQIYGGRVKALTTPPRFPRPGIMRPRTQRALGDSRSSAEDTPAQ